jgi:hypothetical protein
LDELWKSLTETVLHCFLCPNISVERNDLFLAKLWNVVGCAMKCGEKVDVKARNGRGREGKEERQENEAG